jgi:putative ABC transport system substrate-binding protein
VLFGAPHSTSATGCRGGDEVRRVWILCVLTLTFSTALCGFAAAPGHAADTAHRVIRLAVVDPGSPSSTPRDVNAFWERLRELGYIQGQNLVVESHYADTRLTRLPDLMAEVLAHKVDLIVVWGTTAAIAAKNATSTIPIVAAPLGDPVKAGLAVSVARPGGNLTGLSIGWEEGLTGKWLELLEEAVPRLSTVAVIANTDLALHAKMVKELESIAPARGLKVRVIRLHDAQALDRVFDEAAQRAQAVLVLSDPIAVNNAGRIALLAAKHRLPAVFTQRNFVEAGGLMAYGFDVVLMYRRTADYVDSILKGAKPGDLPIEEISQQSLVVNLTAAKVLNLTFPDSIMLRADEVIR